MKHFLMLMAVQAIAINVFSQGSEPFIPISMQPEGTIKAYFRSGMASIRGTSTPVEQNHEMAMMVCFAPDGETVYLQNPISGAYLDTWVRGTLDSDGVTLHVPLPQAMWWYDAFGYGNMLAMVDLNITDEGIFATYDDTATEVTYTFDGDNLRLNGTSSERALGMVFTDDHTPVGMNDWESVYHYEGDQMVEVPAEASRQRYVVEAMNQDRSYEENLYAEVATLGDDVWFRGYSSMLPTAWIHGTRQDEKVFLPKNQLVGTYGGYPLFYCSNQDQQVADGTWTYDAETRSYKAEGYTFVNAKKDDLYHFGYYRSLEYKPASEHDGDYQISSDPIVKKQPQGELRTMMRSGLAYFYNYTGDYIAYTSQGGMPIKLVYADNGVVWMLNPVSYCAEDTWVKGQLSADGRTLTVPLGQQLYYDASEGWGYATAYLHYNRQKKSFDIDESVAQVTFTIDGDVLTLDDCDGEAIYGVIYTDDYTWTGFGDYDVTYSPAPTSSLILPDGVEPELWALTFTDHQGNYDGRMLNVVIQDNKFYMSNLTDDDPEAAVVGTILGDQVTFQSGQYLGLGSGYYCFFDAGQRLPLDEDSEQYYYDYDYAQQVTLNYDAQQRRLSAPEGMSFLIDAGRGELAVSYLTVMDTPFLAAYVEHASVPEDPKFLWFDDEWFLEEGYCSAALQIRPFDVDGNVIPVDRLYYRILIRMGEEVRAWTFYEDEYDFLTEDMELVPYTFTEGYDFGRGGSFFYLYDYGFEDIAVQTVNISGGEERHSNIVWFVAGVEPGTASQAITTLHTDVHSQPMYNLQGQRIDNPAAGTMVIRGGKVVMIK